ncbi:uncharacterized protein LOC120626991 [Pararge aegeria]|uniref:uncharacterized protein LOC120626991 n=1 Tax=Pararge aegeria TaxID=116150 RepID=UPI0019D0FF7E|nr:uncharacterized protein LOC120626991 [Pararge aegeria]
MNTGKVYKFANGYTYGGPTKLRSCMRYRCTMGCGVYLYLTFDVLFAVSQRGARLLLYKGYSYSYQSVKHETVFWKCTMVQPGTSKRCTAKLYTTIDYEVIDDVGSHCHVKPMFIKRNDTMIRVKTRNPPLVEKTEPL